MNKHALKDEGIFTLLFAIVVAGFLFFLYIPLVVLGIGLILFILYFFRDPLREIEAADDIIYAACDGTVVEIKDVNEERFFKGEAKAIHIFMSPTNVHVNRTPITGEVTYQHYQKGKFVPATRENCYEVNERNYIGIENANTKVLLVQVAGIMARRVVSWVEVGQKVNQGDKIGMIKFSSGTQHFLPNSVEVLVKPGDKVQAGITPIGRLV
ncbi:phosphatidylserine decarboxylase [Desulfuribacillus alkaliarsenatis]|uniref:Phosphatidylserine decarboxylase n=1 Tax=Desulfuribacillus alkaliarsenatis TaxID=766136 RepID=A0A1E5G4E8_9FIRM|nr:phosphatidylserine decarboxylase [Desulfuribacillus alkaliarsenatis]OEF97966.1 phosphatidylserine decarboxylase [Desulfuribacillus alkaliarsenatis]